MQFLRVIGTFSNLLLSLPKYELHVFLKAVQQDGSLYLSHLFSQCLTLAFNVAISLSYYGLFGLSEIDQFLIEASVSSFLLNS